MHPIVFFPQLVIVNSVICEHVSTARFCLSSDFELAFYLHFCSKMLFFCHYGKVP